MLAVESTRFHFCRSATTKSRNSAGDFDFRGTHPFSRANAWLKEKGLDPIDWRLD